MTLKEFKEKNKMNPKGFSFRFVCKECSSTNVAFEIKTSAIKEGSGYCETCYSEDAVGKSWIFIKCKKCGNSFGATFESNSYDYENEDDWKRMDKELEKKVGTK